MKKLGFNLATNNVDTLEWSGEKEDIISAEPVVIETYKDHRMAMAFAPAASRFSSLVIRDSGVVTKSYPSFWDDIGKAGYDIIPVGQ